MKFDLEKTYVARGVAILMMVWYHLYGFPKRIIGQEFIPLFQEDMVKGIFVNGIFERISVSVSLFLMGYGMYLSVKKSKAGTFRYSLKKILEFLSRYWVCFIVFVPIGLIFFSQYSRYAWDLQTFIFSIFGLSFKYNNEWWFVEVYLKLMLIFPVLTWLVRKNVLFGFGVALAGILSLKFLDIPAHSNILFWQSQFILGIISVEKDLLNKYLDFLRKENLNKGWFHVFIVMLILIFRAVIFKFSLDAFFIPFFIVHSIGIVRLFNIEKLIASLGRLSLYVWLTHSFFCYYYWQDLVFWPKYLLLIYAWLLTLSIVVSIGLSKLHQKLDGMIFSKMKIV